MTIDEVKKIIAKDESRFLELKTTTGEIVKGILSKDQILLPTLTLALTLALTPT